MHVFPLPIFIFLKDIFFFWKMRSFMCIMDMYHHQSWNILALFTYSTLHAAVQAALACMGARMDDACMGVCMVAYTGRVYGQMYERVYSCVYRHV